MQCKKDEGICAMYDKLIKKHFLFLLQHKFQMKLYDKNAETEAHFQSSTSAISIFIQRDRMEVVVSNRGEQSNLIVYSKIDPTERAVLQQQIEATNTVEQKFAAYGSFIARHLDKINHA